VLDLFKKQKLLLGLIHHLSDINQMTKLHLTKLMFLITKEKTPKFSTYHFHPYKFGPFSYAMYSDINYLVQKGYLIDNQVDSKYIPQLTKKGKDELEISHDQKNFVSRYINKFGSIENLIDEIYSKYPTYTCKSERKNIPIKIKLPSNPGIFLIGYEGKDIDQFLFELISNNINILIDVRKNPRSMKYMFNKGRLIKSLKNVDIRYIHIPELGVPKNLRENLKTKEDYEDLFAQYREFLPRKEIYINKILKLGKMERIALMCFEKDENFCHRGQIGNHIKKKGILVNSI
jgi:uncharacterized protein (DUF488 family)